MSLLREFLDGVQNGENVWEQYRVPLKSKVEKFNNGSRYVYLSTKKVTSNWLDAFYPVFSKADGQLVGGIENEQTSLLVLKFLEILEECSVAVEEARRQQQSHAEYSALVRDLQRDLKTLYCSLETSEMETIRYALIHLFSSTSGKDICPLYNYLYDNSVEWFDEKVATGSFRNCRNAAAHI